MSLHVRLALWYGGLTALVVFAVSTIAYVDHTRGLYYDVDRVLVDDAAIAATALRAGEPGAAPMAELTTLIALYDADGQLTTPASPPLAPEATMAGPSRPAFGRWMAWLPGGGHSLPGAFATVRDERTGDPMRVHATPVLDEGETIAYVQTWTSLAPTEEEVREFRNLMFGMALFSVVLVTGGGLVIGSSALRPVRAMVATGRAIARSRDFRQRVPAPADSARDELADLARTLNEMLDALESAYVMQERFVADAAHELRAPLTAIQGNADLLLRFGAQMDLDDRVEAVAQLEQEARRLTRLVEDLLLLARSDAGAASLRRITPVQLDEIALDAIASLQGLPGAERIHVSELEPVATMGDPDRLRQVLTTVLDNARKYTPPPGAVTVSVRHSEGDAMVTVTDSGEGIDAADLPHVFERFYRADPARSRDPGGSGLGLAIAYAIVEEHGGGITMQSTRGVGTTVTIRLRAVEPNAPQDAGAVTPVLRGSA